MFMGLWGSAKANKENIFYTVLTIFLLERVRRGWNRIGERGRAHGWPREETERAQETFALKAALLYALPLVLPVVKYIFRSLHELSSYVGGLERLANVWALVVVAVAVEAFLAIVIFNLLGIYVERMNAALGFFRRIGRSVVDGSREAVVSGVQAGARGLERRVTARVRALAGSTIGGGWRLTRGAVRGTLGLARGVVRTAQPTTEK